MTTIDTAMLSAMRAAISELLPDTCQIITLTHTADGEGGWTDSRATATAVNCRLDVTQAREQVTGGAIQPYTSYKLSIPYDTTVVTGNEVLHSGVNYAVTGVNLGQSWKAVVRVDLERL